MTHNSSIGPGSPVAAASLADAGNPADNGSRSAQPKLSPKVAIGWAIGSYGMLVLAGTVNSLYLNYIVDSLLIDALVAGLVITVTRIIDAVLDPGMGYISDRTRSKWGRRRPYLLLGAILCGLSSILLFSDPFQILAYGPVIYVTVALCVFSIAHTVFNVPYLAMSYELTSVPKERNLLMSMRVYAIAAGMISAQALAPWIVTEAGGGKQGFAAMGWIFSALVFIPCFIAFAMTKNAKAVVLTNTVPRPRLNDFLQVFSNKPFRWLVVTKSSYMLGAGVHASAIAFFVTKVLDEKLSILALYGVFQLGSVIVSQPAWVWICNRIGKRRAFIIAAPVNALANLSWLFVSPGASDLEYIVRAVISGLAAGGMMLAVQAMLPDTMEHESQRSERPQEGVLAGVFTTIERGVSALSVAMTGFIISFGGYLAGADVQSESAIQALYFCVAVMPALGMFISILAIRLYSLHH